HTLKLLLISAITCCLFSCGNNKEDAALIHLDALNETINSLNDAIVEDGFSPPVASRIYAYPYIAAYEAFALTSADYQSILPDLNGVNFSFDDMEIDHEKYISEVASSFAFFHVAKPLIYRPYIIDTVEQHLLQRYKKSTLKQTDIEYSISIAQQIGDRIIAYSKSDNYKQTRN